MLSDTFVFKILLHNNIIFFAVFLLLWNISVSNEGIAGENWVFLCLRGEYFPVYQDLGKAL